MTGTIIGVATDGVFEYVVPGASLASALELFPSQLKYYTDGNTGSPPEFVEGVNLTTIAELADS